MRHLLLVLVMLASIPPCRAGGDSPAVPDEAKRPTGVFALAPLIGAAPEPVERDQPTQPQPDSMQTYDQHLASDTPSDLDRLARLASLLSTGEPVARPELDWARDRLNLALGRRNVERAEKLLAETIRREGLSDDFGGDQVLPPGAPDAQIAPYVEMKLRGAREEAKQLLDLINSKQ